MSGAVQEGLMLNGFQSTSGIGVDTRVVKMNMTWENFPLTSRFYAKLVKYDNDNCAKANSQDLTIILMIRI